MHAEDRTVLLDLENHGTLTPRPRPMRARLQALLAAGEHHHAVAAYALADDALADDQPDVLASVARRAGHRGAAGWLRGRTRPSWRCSATPATSMPKDAGSS